MGQFPERETHVERLSDKSDAWRWVCARKKQLLPLMIVALAASCLYAAMVYGTQFKVVTIIADGNTEEIVTAAETVGEVLEEQGVEVGAHDAVSLPLDHHLKHGSSIIIERAFPVRIRADGEETEVFTTGGAVADVLQKAGIRVGPYDRVEPALDERLTAAADVRIVRVEKILETTKHPLPFDTVKQEDPALMKGREKVLREGREGVLIKMIEKVYEDGVLVSEQVVSRTVERESEPRIVAVGAKVEQPKPVTNAVAVLSAETQEVTLNGMTFGVRGVLKNVTLTAYSAHAESTGKSKGDKGYGITASGTKVQEGRTIAVDKDVIPLGWWVYIDGIGFRRAEDTGSAIKGKKIDLYFDSAEHAKKFGTKKGFTVYVIGPKKPVVN